MIPSHDHVYVFYDASHRVQNEKFLLCLRVYGAHVDHGGHDDVLVLQSLLVLRVWLGDVSLQFTSSRKK